MLQVSAERAGRRGMEDSLGRLVSALLGVAEDLASQERDEAETWMCVRDTGDGEPLAAAPAVEVVARSQGREPGADVPGKREGMGREEGILPR